MEWCSQQSELTPVHTRNRPNCARAAIMHELWGSSPPAPGKPLPKAPGNCIQGEGHLRINV